jgi:hypothetical protein
LSTLAWNVFLNALSKIAKANKELLEGEPQRKQALDLVSR